MSEENNELFDQMLTDSQALPSEDKLGKINSLYIQMVGKQNMVAELEARLSMAKKELLQISDYELPSAMQEAGCKVFVTNDGWKLEIKQFYTAKIDDNNRESCFGWLRDKGHEGIIKHSVSANFAKGEDGLANTLKQTLSAMGVTYTDKESVHPQTLMAFVRERIEKGEEFPLTMFNVFVGNTTKVKRV